MPLHITERNCVLRNKYYYTKTDYRKIDFFTLDSHTHAASITIPET
jgi:hypothetical protein